MNKIYRYTCILTVLFGQAFSQVNWTKHPENPVLKRGNNGSWDDIVVANPNVMFDGSLYHMWYSGFDGSNTRIGYASSSDGISWTKHSVPVVDRGSGGSWDEFVVFQPSVVYDGETWHMWFSGHKGGLSQIGYASSADSIHWTKHGGNPVLTPGTSGSWDSQGVGTPNVVLIKGVFHMWYAGSNGSYDQIGHATSTDGITWEKDPSNPVLTGADADWEQNNVLEPSVLIGPDSVYHMFYSAGSQYEWSTGYAYSMDGRTWIKYDANPILTPGDNGGWDDGLSGLAGALWNEESGTFEMWYVGGPTAGFGGWNIGYATASLEPDGIGIDWTRNKNNPVFPRGPNGTWDDTFVSGPSVSYDEGNYHMWYSGYDGASNGQDVGYANSEDGINWSRKGSVLHPGNAGNWDGISVFQPSVIVTDTIKYMWYCGHNSNDLNDRKIGYAWSDDGISWTKYLSNPVLGPGSNGSWDDTWVGAPEVVVINGFYHMFYEGNDGTYTQIGHATSADGFTWEKDSLNPVLSVGTTGSWDDLTVGGPAIWHNGRVFYMWYAGGENTAFDWKVGYAWSFDGSHWIKVSVDGPDMELGIGGSWDDTFNAAGGIAVLYNDNLWGLDMWYGGGTGFSIGDIGHAFSYEITSIGKFHNNTPGGFELSQNYPNPFNPVTQIDYQVAKTGNVNLSVYNMLGQRVATLVDKNQTAGRYSVQWDASGFASGIYYYKIETDKGFAEAKKLVLIK